VTENVVGDKKQTRHVGRRVAQSIFDACKYAEDAGYPLNRYVVINFRGGDPSEVTKAFQIFRRRFRGWLEYKREIAHAGQDCEPAYVYTFENPSDIPHVNWLVHIPPALLPEFDRKVLKWAEKIPGFDMFDLKVKPIAWCPGLANYINKGVDPLYQSHFHLEYMAKEHGPQGVIWGKRAGVSPFIGRTARKAAEWHRRNRKLAA
jgi:hypothetical protein